jgi:hypothetical protein
MPSPLFYFDKEIAMKNGRSLVSLAQELERQLHSKKDLDRALGTGAPCHR